MTLIRIAQVAIALGLLVFVHEFGHFLAAKLAGVRVEVFSFGFGPFLLSFRRGETVYALSLIPFGGYVRMTGQADIGRVKEDDRVPEHSYAAKPPSKRSMIIGAGVVMNMVFAYFVFVLAYLVGFPVVQPEATVVGEGTPAAEAGLEPGDRIIGVNGSRIDRFSTIRTIIAAAPDGEPVELLIERPGVTEPVTVSAVPVPARDGLKILGFSPAETVGLRIGAENVPGLGVQSVNPSTPAESAGLQAGDVILFVDDRKIDGLKSFKEALAESDGREVKLGVLRRGGHVVLHGTARDVNRRQERTETADDRAADDPDGTGEEQEHVPLYQLGFVPTKQIVGRVLPGSPAERAGIREGDFISEVTRSLDESHVEVAWRSPDGEKHSAILEQPDPESYHGPVFDAGLDSKFERRQSGFPGAFADGFRECGLSVWMAYKTIGALVRGRVSPKHLSGAVAIVAYTHNATKRGLGYYLWFVAFISINLAVFNILPVVPLDGGLLVFLGYEALRGRPASARIQEAVQIAGLVLILALVIYVTSNDIARIFPSS